MSLASTFKITFGFIYRLTSGLIQPYIQTFFFNITFVLTISLQLASLLTFFQPYIWPHKQLIFGLTLDFFLQPYIWPHNQLTFGFTSNFTFGLTFGQTFSFTFVYTFSLTYIFIQLHDFIIQLLDSLACSLTWFIFSLIFSLTFCLTSNLTPCLILIYSTYLFSFIDSHSPHIQHHILL